MPQELGAWATVHSDFRQWHDAGVSEGLLEGLIAAAARRGIVDLTLVSVDSTTMRAHHDAAGMHLDQDLLTVLEKVATEDEKARSKGAASTNKAGTTPRPMPTGEERRHIRRCRRLRLTAALSIA
ncbi:hypothetical protein SAMN04490357_0404 [Streptomyces misionensis]|uniref:Transposase n=1 Tax=Streptomyces misionensis TaxID=67331 RepID=A0A1H4M8F8_9ACTN|nr:hypothetical protein SAMN04490357_0404 [Streptomyces misionensis]